MWDDERQLTAIAAMLGAFAIAMLAFGVVAWAARQPAFAFREVIVRGPLEVDVLTSDDVFRHPGRAIEIFRAGIARADRQARRTA